MFPDDLSAAWFKSSYSAAHGDCVEVAHLPVSFQKSSYSASQTACVEVASWPAGAAIRDTKHRNLGTLAFPRAEWRAFIEEVKRGSL